MHRTTIIIILLSCFKFAHADMTEQVMNDMRTEYIVLANQYNIDRARFEQRKDQYRIDCQRWNEESARLMAEMQRLKQEEARIKISSNLVQKLQNAPSNRSAYEQALKAFNTHEGKFLRDSILYNQASRRFIQENTRLQEELNSLNQERERLNNERNHIGVLIRELRMAGYSFPMLPNP